MFVESKTEINTNSDKITNVVLSYESVVKITNNFWQICHANEISFHTTKFCYVTVLGD